MITSAQMTGNSYRTAYSYDQRGNLLTLDRYDANGTMIDDLSYIPYSGTNKIKNLFDGGTSAGFDEGDAPIFAAYTYDANGNLAHDPFKNLDIAYNHLNLPDTIIQPGSTNRIVWHYDAAGNKLRKEVLNDSIILTGPFTENQYQARFITTDGQPTALDSTLLVAQDSIVFKPGFHAQVGMRLTAKIDSTIVPVDSTDYIGGVEYQNGSIQAIYHPVGRAVPSGSNWRHEYVITDHLGNTRLRFSDLDENSQIDSIELLSVHDYYPYGMEWNAGGYKYTYNGKEMNTEIGLNLIDFGARMQDPSLGKFISIDRFAEKNASQTPYSYAANNPIKFIDVNGDSIDISGLSEKDRETFNQLYQTLSKNEIFNTYYQALSDSETIYTISIGSGEGGSGSFNAKTNEVSFIGPETMAQELFHAYQSDLGIYTRGDASVREAEGDIVSGSIMNSLGLPAKGTAFWDQGIIFEFVDENLNFNHSVLTPAFDNKFNSAVDARINFYKNKEKQTQARAPAGYVQPNSRVGALALKTLIKLLYNK
jgi:RHS repeat-associated protein